MKKVLSCILSFLPLITLFGAVLGIFVFMLFTTDPMSDVEIFFAILMVAGAFVAVFLTYFVMIWYIVKICKRKDIQIAVKVIWCICLYYFNVFSFPVFWFMYIRNE